MGANGGKQLAGTPSRTLLTEPPRWRLLGEVVVITDAVNPSGTNPQTRPAAGGPSSYQDPGRAAYQTIASRVLH
ncbi:hypothetical protein Misp05_45310 [Micromonospora sp. NBRC 107095]|nr:hypothetical protein Misp05_45310 [Micromonospora sp. NBRC 107095]